MNMSLSSKLGVIGVCAALCLQASPVMAEIIATDKASEQNQSGSQGEREKVQAFLDRADVKQRLQALGVAGLAATDRVAALTDEEVHTLAQKIDSMPAGGNLSNSDIIVILLVAILVAIAI